MLPTKFKVNKPFDSEKKRKIDFQDGRNGRHLGFPIRKILAFFLPISQPDASYMYQVLSQLAFSV